MTGGHAEDQHLAVARAGRGEAAVGREAHVRHGGAVVALRGDHLHRPAERPAPDATVAQVLSRRWS